MENIKRIPKPVMPTEKQMQEVSADWWANLEPISFGKWSQEVKDYSMPLVQIPVTDEWCHHVAEPEIFSRDEIKLDMSSVPSGWYPFFAKTNSRSGKDVGNNKYYSVKHFIASLTASARTHEDLCLFSHSGNKCEIIVRPWVEIPKQDEWRMFVKDGVLVGISQYHYFDVFEYEKRTEIVVRWGCQKLMEIINKSMPIRDYVCDVFITNDYPVLIEINPWGLSDPCLFETYSNLDGSFKINTVD
jgi:hypothetical protein